ncbi:MAG: glycogen debranching protein GlgX [Desulfoarculaceae bacterium]|nr:glycogen debranching protein GlgX [Desulfoarculaceae bacterium]
MSKKKTFSPTRGFALPTGSTILSKGINFSIFSRHAQEVTLVIDLPETTKVPRQQVQIPLHPEINRTGDLWHILIQTTRDDLRYGYRIKGPVSREKNGLVYDDQILLLDPASHIHTPRAWGERTSEPDIPRCAIIKHDFDWQDDQPLNIPLAKSIIYELHVRGFTRHKSSQVTRPGTYRGIIEKIPYLQGLGITAVELMPVTEFDENDNVFRDPVSGKPLKNFWGYNPVSFFALKSGYAADRSQHINEFKAMVLALHQAGIEVILDMVFNHTGEGGYDGTTSSFRGIDNRIYYLLDHDTHEYLNFSGCGNTMNCNHPVVRELIRDALRYWVMEMHVDGFRFDLASILGRDTRGHLLANPPMIEMIAEDPVLRDTKIIAEAWDAAGLYQVGTFSTDARWAEWNGMFRDDVRAFMAGLDDTVGNLATRIGGSADLYQSSRRHPFNSINFLTSHDGFTLSDLVSFNKKHNEANGEENRDGDNHNLSWNSGAEGLTRSKIIQELRLRRMRSMILILFLSQGVPMITAGDEFGHSKKGNNNSWCQDNNINWLNWDLTEKNKGLLRFFTQCIHLRKDHSIFQRTSFFTHPEDDECIEDNFEIIWQSLKPCEQDWSAECHTLAFLLNGSRTGSDQGDHFFIMLNGDREEDAIFTLPPIPGNSHSKQIWYQIIDTSLESPYNFLSRQQAPARLPKTTVTVKAMGAIVLQSPSSVT